MIPALIAPLWLAPAALHPGSPLYAQFVIEREQVELQFFGEQKSVNAWFGIEGLHVPPVDPELTRAAEEAAPSLLAERVRIDIDGQRVAAELLELAFEGPSPVNPEPQLRLRARYPADSPPSRIAVEWDLFAPDTGGWRFPVLFRREGDDPLFTEFTTAEPAYEWVSSGLSAPRGTAEALPAVAPGEREPGDSWRLALAWLGACGLLGAAVRSPRVRRSALTVGAIGAALVWISGRTSPGAVVMPSEDVALAMFSDLHGRIYDAFKAESEDMIYELLASAVADTAIDELYGDVYESLVLRNEGGAFCRVETVEPLASTVRFLPGEDDPLFEVDHMWRVGGSVSHWGHEHQRTNAYHAVYTVGHDGAAWRIADWEVLEHRRADDGRSFVTLIGEEDEWGEEEEWETDEPDSSAEAEGSAEEEDS